MFSDIAVHVDKLTGCCNSNQYGLGIVGITSRTSSATTWLAFMQASDTRNEPVLVAGISDGRIGNHKRVGEGKDGMHAGVWVEGNRSNDVGSLAWRAHTGLV